MAGLARTRCPPELSPSRPPLWVPGPELGSLRPGACPEVSPAATSPWGGGTPNPPVSIQDGEKVPQVLVGGAQSGANPGVRWDAGPFPS